MRLPMQNGCGFGQNEFMKALVALRVSRSNEDVHHTHPAAHAAGCKAHCFPRDETANER